MKSIFAWIGRLFKSITHDAAKVAVAITEQVQSGLKSGLFFGVATIVDDIFHTHLGADVVAFLNNNIHKLVSAELAIEGLPDNPTSADIEAFAARIAEAISGRDQTGKSKLWTTLAAQIAHIIETQVNVKEPLSFAQLVKDVEEAYQDYLDDLANNKEEDSEGEVDATDPDEQHGHDQTQAP